MEKAMKALVDAAKLALLELQQLHGQRYPDCKEGCPAYEAIDALNAALEQTRAAGDR